MYWQDEVVFGTTGDTPGGRANQAWAYALVNGRPAYAGIPLQKGSLDVALYSRNLLDRKYCTCGIEFGASLGVAGNQ